MDADDDGTTVLDLKDIKSWASVLRMTALNEFVRNDSGRFNDTAAEEVFKAWGKGKRKCQK